MTHLPIPSPIPPASFGPPPRKVRADDPFNPGCVTAFCIPFIVVGILLVLSLLLQILVTCIGSKVPATVTATRTENDPNSFPSTYYVLNYQYQVSAQTFTDSAYVSREVYDFHNPPDPAKPITVTYLHLGSFSTSQTKPFYDFSVRDLLFISVTIIWNAFIWLIIFHIHRIENRPRRLCTFGQYTQGHITSKHTDDSGDFTAYKLTYTYTDPATQKVHTDTCLVDSDRFARVNENHPVTVFYDPAKPHISIPYEFSNCKIL